MASPRGPAPTAAARGGRVAASTRSRLSRLRSLVSLSALLAWVLLPADRGTVLDLFGVGLLVVAAAEGLASLGLQRRGRLPALVRALAPAAGGVVLLLGEQEDLARLATATGVLLVVRGLGDLLAALLVGSRIRDGHWLVGLGLLELVAGAVTVGLADLFAQAGIVVLGLAWIGGGVVPLLAPEHRRDSELTMAPRPRLSRLTEDERDRIAQEVFFDGPAARDRLVRFTVLLSLATVIATYGVLGDSVPTVIGAMIVAPLMMPIQSLSAALVAGRPRQAGLAALLLVGGMLLTLVLSMFLASTFRDLDVVLGYGQVTSRVHPALTDFAVALAAGAAGGFALLRRDVADSLPGVAVAVSLVPPLCVSGALLAGGDEAGAAGAFLLFATNFVAIVIASGSVLFLGGFGRLAGQSSRQVLTIGVAATAAVAAVAAPLSVTGLGQLREESLTSAVDAALVDWLDPVEPADVLLREVSRDTVHVVVLASQRPPPVAALERAVEAEVGRDVTIDVRWVTAPPLP